MRKIFLVYGHYNEKSFNASIRDTFIEAANEKGITRSFDFNTGQNEGCGYFQVTEKNGLRCSTAVAYLNPIKKRNNLKVIVKAHIKKILFHGLKAIGIECWINNEIKSLLNK